MTNELGQNPIPAASMFYEPDLDFEDDAEQTSQFATPQRIATPVPASPAAASLVPGGASSSSSPLLQSAAALGQEPTLPPTANKEKKMHQSSTRIMKVTPDGRPFSTDFLDLFCTLIVSLPLNSHRARFRSYSFSFATEEAIANLANLKFSQSNRMADPNDSTRVVTTTTTTTFSMAKDMARALCQRFIDVRLIECPSDKSQDSFKDKVIWQLTPKGLSVLNRFVTRNAITKDVILKILAVPSTFLDLVSLERDTETDEILQDKSVIELIFRRFAGRRPNIKASAAAADSESITESMDGITGIKLLEYRKIAEQTFKKTLTGRNAILWLLDYTTVLESNEAYIIANLFVFYGLIQLVGDLRGKQEQSMFPDTKYSIYFITAKGCRAVGWETGDDASLLQGAIQEPRGSLVRTGSSLHQSVVSQNNGGEAMGKKWDEKAVSSPRLNGGTVTRETNTHRLNLILSDPALRSQFKQFLRENYCEENLSFYLDVLEFGRQMSLVKASSGVSEALAKAYSIYNAFLAPGSPYEINLEHSLRLDMAALMTQTVDNDEQSMFLTLKSVAELYDRARRQVFRLMAGDSVPKFLRNPEYLQQLENHSDSDDDDF